MKPVTAFELARLTKAELKVLFRMAAEDAAHRQPQMRQAARVALQTIARALAKREP